VVERDSNDEIYLVGHSLGVPAILRFLETTACTNIEGAVLVSGPFHSTYEKIANFYETPFSFERIKLVCSQFTVIHGDNDSVVPFGNAQKFAHELNGDLISIPNGGHLNGSSGFDTLPEALTALQEMFIDYT